MLSRKQISNVYLIFSLLNNWSICQEKKFAILKHLSFLYILSGVKDRSGVISGNVEVGTQRIEVRTSGCDLPIDRLYGDPAERLELPRQQNLQEFEGAI